MKTSLRVLTPVFGASMSLLLLGSLASSLMAAQTIALTLDPAAAGRWIVTLESDGWRLQTPAAATGLSEVRLGAARATN